jgi:hypothetical protein
MTSLPFLDLAIEFCLGFGNWDLELLDRVKPENEKESANDHKRSGVRRHCGF